MQFRVRDFIFIQLLSWIRVLSKRFWSKNLFIHSVPIIILQGNIFCRYFKAGFLGSSGWFLAWLLFHLLLLLLLLDQTLRRHRRKYLISYGIWSGRPYKSVFEFVGPTITFRCRIEILRHRLISTFDLLWTIFFINWLLQLITFTLCLLHHNIRISLDMRTHLMLRSTWFDWGERFLGLVIDKIFVLVYFFKKGWLLLARFFCLKIDITGSPLNSLIRGQRVIGQTYFRVRSVHEVWHWLLLMMQILKLNIHFHPWLPCRSLTLILDPEIMVISIFSLLISRCFNRILQMVWIYLYIILLIYSD